MKFEDWVKEVRINEGLSAQEAAEMIGISRVYLYKIESGENKNISIKIFNKIVRAYGLNPSEIIDEFDFE